MLDLNKCEVEVCKAFQGWESVMANAEASGRSPKTMRNQIQMIYEKIRLSSDTELIGSLSVFRTGGTMFDGQNTSLTASAARRQIEK